MKKQKKEEQPGNAATDQSTFDPGAGKSTEALGKREVYDENEELFQDHFLEQYKLYVEMADRISSRRHNANVFFLSLQTGIFSLIGLSLTELRMIHPKWILALLTVGLILFCVAWWWIINSYRNLNSAKFKVIGKMEQSLPSSPYWEEEWKALGEGKDPKKYLPLTKVEQFLPVIFGFLYLVIGYYLVTYR